MKRLVQQFRAFLHRLVKAPRDRLLDRLRAHMALAVNDDVRGLVRHVTAERVALSTEFTERITSELAPVHRQLDDLNLCNDALLHEIVRLQRELQQLVGVVGQLAPERLPLSRSPGDAPHLKLADAQHLKLVDGRQVRAA